MRGRKIKEFIYNDKVKVYGLLGFVAVVMALSAAGVLSGVGLFILSMLSMDAVRIISSSVFLTVSLTVFVSGYLWLTS